MKKRILMWVAALALATSSAGAFASDRDQATLVGGVVGAFAGAMIGQQVSGNDGVLPGVLLGAAAGAAIGSSADRPHYYHQRPVRYAPPPGYYYGPRPGYRYRYHGDDDHYRRDDRDGWYGDRRYRH